MKQLHTFDDIFDTQKTFRLLLDAMANPSRVVSIQEGAEKLYGSKREMLTLAMTLLDKNTGFYTFGHTELDEQIDMALPRRLTLDLSGLSFTDSSGIAVLIRVSRRMEQIKGELIVRGVPPQPWKVFQAAGLHKLIRFEQEEPAAAGEEDVHK